MNKYPQRDYIPLLALIVLVAVVVGAIFVKRASCFARWPDNRPSWGLIQGCMIEIRGGQHVPADVVRNIAP